MQLINSDRATFEKLDSTRRIIDADHAHRFAILHLEQWGAYGLGWHSDLIEPSISTLGKLIWIGVDQNIVALDSTHGRVQMALPLWTPLFEIAIWNDSVIVISELEISAFNRDASLRFFEDCPILLQSGRFRMSKCRSSYWIQSTLLLDLRSGKVLSAITS